MPATPLDVLALAAHPDDAELCAGGILCLLDEQGYRTGVVDFTRGELGSRGTPEARMKEAAAAADLLGLDARDNLGLPDGDIANTDVNRRALIQRIRRYRPHITLINSLECRHPDHGNAARLAIDALYYSGLRKIETADPRTGEAQEPWRPHHVLHYMQAIEFEPTLVVDVSSVWERRTQALQAFESQFHHPDYKSAEDEPETFISTPEFFEWVESRARAYGYRIGATHGEPLLYRHGPIGTEDLARMLAREVSFR